MSNLIKTALKELTEDLNIIQTKKREISRKYDIQSRMKLFEEITNLKKKIADSVNKFLLI
jgi:hypothetical protein